jgi:hypothetical protein
MIKLEKLESEEDWNWFKAVLDRSMKESIMLEKASKCFDPAPPSLFENGVAEESVKKKLASLYQKLGGVPDVFLIRKGARPTDRYDEFAWCAVNEMISLFQRARTGVVKTHSIFIAYSLISKAPSTFEASFTPEQLACLEPVVKEDFWNQAETAYIRLASLWDRAGQLLDYVFFNIRQFEYDGFSAVLDRIKANFAILDPSLERSSFWINIKTYAHSEKTDGLKWLLRRRNLLVHTLHLGDRLDRAKEEMEILYYYNHLEEATRKKLGTLPPEEELLILHGHLTSFTRLLEPLCDLCLWGADLIHDMRKVKESVIS